MNLLSTLFNYLILDSNTRTNWLEGWANNYLIAVNRVQWVGTQIQSKEAQVLGNELLENNKYSEFMSFWLKQKSNGISSCGQSILSGDKFNTIIEDNEFVGWLNNYLTAPTFVNFRVIKDNWKDKIGKDNKVLYNRTAAAVETSLTCVVDEDKFYQVLRYLQKDELGYDIEVTKSWYQDNKQLTAWLDEELQADLINLEESLPTPKGTDQILWRAIWRNIFVWEIYSRRPGMFDLKKNIVKYGAPGTGKTYTCKSDAANHFGFWKALYRADFTGKLEQQIETVQFHPSFTYEDFMEGIKPVPSKEGNAELKLVNGIFKSFCKKAAQWEMEIYKAFPDRNWTEAPLETLRINEAKSKLREEKWSFLESKQDNDDDNPKYLHQYIPPFYLIIDEINRAELSRVMGELMLCLEYRGLAGRIKTQYSYLSQKGTDTDYWREEDSNYFFVPHNVFILATMNTIDRSVESFDFALRRRFRWIEVPPNYDTLVDYLKNKTDNEFLISGIVEGLKILNEAINDHPLLGKDFQIGHAYFMNLPGLYYKMKVKELKEELWQNSIQPLLEEYLRGSGEVKSTTERFKKDFKKGDNG